MADRKKLLIAAVAIAAGLALLFNGALGLTIDGFGDIEAYAGIGIAIVGAILLLLTLRGA